MVKEDGCVAIHADGALNWMNALISSEEEVFGGFKGALTLHEIFNDFYKKWESTCLQKDGVSSPSAAADPS